MAPAVSTALLLLAMHRHGSLEPLPAEPQEAEVMKQDSLRLPAALLQEEHGSGRQVCRTAPNILRLATKTSWETHSTMVQASSDGHAQAWWIHPLDADNL